MKQLVEWTLVTIALFVGAAASGIILGDFHWQFIIGVSVGVGFHMLMGSESKEKK